MRLTCSLAVVFALSALQDTRAEQTVKGYPTQLTLDGDLQPGPGQTISGGGAPDAPGIWVELWRIPPGTAAAESVASVLAAGGSFAFEGVDVQEGEHYYVTLSRSWQFNTDGDAEGWDQLTNDVTLQVAGGSLNVTIDGLDPHFFNYFEHNADYYRVIEIRLFNPAAPAFQNPPFQDLAILWGDFSTQSSGHFAEIPSESTVFETVTIPMNVGEGILMPGPFQFDVDGLWATGLHDVLRIDPLDTTDSSAIGTVFQIDFIRIREDLRVEFHDAGDPMGIGVFNDVTELTINDGFLNYTVADAASVDPYVLLGLATGKVESAYFSHFAIGMENSLVAESSNSVGAFFNDDDSGSSYTDDGGTLQVAEFPGSLSGRVDLFASVDSSTVPTGEWTEDGRVPLGGTQFSVPGLATSGDTIRIDYLGFVPASPYGPSDAVLVPFPLIVTGGCLYLDEVMTFKFSGGARLDGSDTNLDGSPGQQPLVLGVAIAPGEPADANASGLLSQIDPDKYADIVGVGSSPSVGESSDVDVDALIDTLVASATLTYTDDDVKNVYIGSVESPEVTYIEATKKVTFSNVESTGAGILVVDARELVMSGSSLSKFYGLVVARVDKKVTFSGSPEHVLGAVIIASRGGSEIEVVLSGESSLLYSSEALDLAAQLLSGTP